MVDMHIHSYYSDGDTSPSDLVRRAKEMGLKGIALTDHDTFAGVSELMEAGKQMQFPVYAGVEISCMNQGNGRQVHILGYDLDENGMRQLDELLCPVRESMQKAVRKSIVALEQNGYPISLEAVLGKAGPTKMLYKQMIMEVFMEAKLCEEMYGGLYKKLFKKGENGKAPIAALQVDYANPVEMVKNICRVGGKAVLAHPGQYDSYELIPDLVEAGLAGIEVYHPLHTAEDIEKSLTIAKQYGLFCTGGSDYHGKYGEGEKLGQCGAYSYPIVTTTSTSFLSAL